MKSDDICWGNQGQSVSNSTDAHNTFENLVSVNVKSGNLTDNSFEVLSIRDPKHNDRVISKSFFTQHENCSKLFIGRLHYRSHGICVKIHAKEHLHFSKEFEITKLFKKISFQGEKNNQVLLAMTAGASHLFSDRRRQPLTTESP